MLRVRAPTAPRGPRRRPRGGRHTALLAAALLTTLPSLPLAAQPATERSPNMGGTWVTSPGNLHFQFAHRFQVAGQDADVSDIFGTGTVVNYPTFDIAVGLFRDAMAGVRYSSNSRVARQANEWQPYLRVAPIRGTGDGDVSLGATLAWNDATESVDGELGARTQLGRLFLLAAVRGFSDVFALGDRSDEAVAAAGGVGVRLNRYVTLAADVADLVGGPVDASAGWSAGLQVGIPATPHTLSIQATNVYSGTLEGASTGNSDTVFWGFEFTVPFSGFARWGEIFGGEEEERTAPAAPAGARAVEVEISDLSFGPDTVRVASGTVVRWVNRDPVGHTTTSDTGLWDSPLIGPGETYSRRFDAPGTHPYHCTPHRFMEGVVIVTEGEGGA